jgi:putative component of toxin-antitoxin plasmid stabilization module
VEVRQYQMADGKAPMVDWLEGLHDGATRARVTARLDRLKVAARRLEERGWRHL